MQSLALLFLLPLVLDLPQDPPQEVPPPAQPTKEHEWLQHFVGDWTFSSECNMGPDAPPLKVSGSETVKALGGLWILGEGRIEMDGETMHTRLTLGYDPQRKAFVGTWIDTMQTHLWHYRGQLDAQRKVLTLETEGPSFADPTQMAKFHDIFEIVDEHTRTLSSEIQMPDGSWFRFLKAEYRRKGAAGATGTEKKR